MTCRHRLYISPQYKMSFLFFKMKLVRLRKSLHRRFKLVLYFLFRKIPILSLPFAFCSSSQKSFLPNSTLPNCDNVFSQFHIASHNFSLSFCHSLILVFFLRDLELRIFIHVSFLSLRIPFIKSSCQG